MTIESYNFSRNEFEKRLSDVMDIVVSRLVADGLIKSDDAKTFCDTHTITIVSKRTLTERIAKLLGIADNDTALIRVVKIRDKDE